MRPCYYSGSPKEDAVKLLAQKDRISNWRLPGNCCLPLCERVFRSDVRSGKCVAGPRDLVWLAVQDYR